MPNGGQAPPSLDQVLVAFQKSLSRAWQQAQTVSREDLSIQNGEKPLFTVEALEVELRVGLDLGARSEELASELETVADPDIVRVNFDQTLRERSVIKFRVAMKPLDLEER